MKEHREKECRKMILIIESLGFTYKFEDLMALYKSDRSKFLEIRDICDEFKSRLKTTTPMSNIFLRHDDAVVGFKSHPGVHRIDETCDQLSSYNFGDLKPVILRHEEDEEEEEELTEHDKIEFIMEMMVDLEEILMEPGKKSKKRKASSTSSSSSSFDASFDCEDAETDSVSDTSVYTEEEEESSETSK